MSNAPPAFASIWQEYCDYIDAMDVPAESKYIGVHEGHCSWLLEAERKFMNPAAIRSSCLWGTPEQIVQQIRELEQPASRACSCAPGAHATQGHHRLRGEGHATL